MVYLVRNWPSAVNRVKGLLEVCFLEFDMAFFISKDLLQHGAASTSVLCQNRIIFGLVYLSKFTNQEQ